MSYAVWLVPVGLAMGMVGLLAFLWSMKSGQLEDLDGAAERVLVTDVTDRPLPASLPRAVGAAGGAASPEDKAKRSSAS